MEATMRKQVSSHFVYLAFRLLPFRLLPFRLLSQQTNAEMHCNYIRLETSSVYEIILPYSPNQILSDHASLNRMKQPQIII